ncbi:MAG TPA: hypothetical protein VM056_04880 [Terriglobales bacterium]|nr:hypothetical protein [Terriglobales bacterium]
MFENELQDLRRHKWRVDSPSRAIFTVDDAREFLHSVGYCLLYPLRPAVIAPVFIGAFTGTDHKLPTAKQAFLDPRAKEAEGLKVRLLREQSAFEVAFGEDGTLLVAAAEFPFFYALMGERNPKQPPSAGTRGEKALLTHAFEMIQAAGPITERDLRKRLGESVSDVALARTLHELWSQLRIVRIDEGETAETWDVLYRWAPEVINQGKQISAAEALSALVSKYLETCVAAELKDVEDFFGHVVPRSRVADVVRALQGAREVSFTQVHGKTLLRNSPRVSEEEKVAQATAMAAVNAAHKAFPKRPWQKRADGAKSEAWKRYGPRGDADSRPPRGEGFKPRAAGFAKKPFGDKPSGDKPWKRSGPPREGKPWQKPSASVDAKPWAKSSGPREGRPFQKSGPARGDKPWQKSGPPRGDKPWQKSGSPRGNKPWQKSGPPREGASPESRGPRTDRPWAAKSSGFKSDRPPFKRPFSKDSSSGSRFEKPFGKKPFEKKPFEKKPFGQKTFGQKAFGKKPWEKKTEAGEGSAVGEPTATGERRPWKDRPSNSNQSATRSARPAFKSESKAGASGGYSKFKGIGKKPGGFKAKSGFGAGAKPPFKKSASKFGAKPKPRTGTSAKRPQ